MTAIFIIHGIYGHSQENWFPWLKKELERLGHRVFVPDFPSPESPCLAAWLKKFDEYKTNLNEDAILIGHSLGVAFILTLLEKFSVKASFFVAGFAAAPDNQFKEKMKNFTEKNFDWKKIKKHCPRFYIYHSDNDPYVPLEKGKELAKNLETNLLLVKKAGHFNEAAGYLKFEKLLEDIKRLL